MANNDSVADEHDLTRWVKPRLLAVGEDGQIAFVYPQAFELRENEDYLSLTNIDTFGGDRDVRLAAAARAIEQSTDSQRLARSGAFVVGNCADMKSACQEYGHKVRVLSEPELGNAGHVAVRRYPRDHTQLYECLASEVFRECRSSRELLD